jgi:hypothetical protein
LAEVNQRLKAKVTTPMSNQYRTELDATPEHDNESSTYFQGLIGVLRWIVELGRIDIMVAVSMLSSHLMAPRDFHLELCFHIFAYLDTHEHSRLVFDPTYCNIDEACFTNSDWSQYYPDASEAYHIHTPP